MYFCWRWDVNKDNNDSYSASSALPAPYLRSTAELFGLCVIVRIAELFGRCVIVHIFCHLFHFFKIIFFSRKHSKLSSDWCENVSEYDQEIPQSHTTDQPMAPR